MPPNIPHTEVKSVTWTNYHGTIRDKPVATYCTPDVLGEAGSGAPRRMARHAEALKAILEHCISGPTIRPLRVVGSTWSLSNIIEPDEVVLDPGYLNIMLKIRKEWTSAAYQAGRGALGYVPIFVQGGTKVATINRRFGELGLALQTSGASDGHRIAGCVATGTHGSALDIGAVHDTLLAVHLVVSPAQSLFLRRKDAPITDDVPAWLEKESGLATTVVPVDTDQFAAALVSLGSLGVVFGVVIEAAPLYQLERMNVVRPLHDPEMWRAMETLDSAAIAALTGVAERPYHFSVVLNPYARAGKPGAFATAMWKVAPGGTFAPAPPVRPDSSSDLMGLVGDLSDTLDGALPSLVLTHILNGQVESRYPPGPLSTVFPGEAFGPTGLPPGHGTSTEIVVDHARAIDALAAVLEVLGDEARADRHLLGGIGVRFVPRTDALLGMNIHAMNCYIELPSIRNDEVEAIYAKCWAALDDAVIPYACHWGQLLPKSPNLTRYFGPRVARWQAARVAMIPDPKCRSVFASRMLAHAGLS
jgi:hypothetical protein